MKVLLFDIDGTLIRSGGAGKVALHAALTSHFSVKEIRDRVLFSGRTDPGIGVDLLRIHDLEVSPENLLHLELAYLQHLPDALEQNPGSIMPGVLDWLDSLNQASHVKLGLLTGNVRRGAELKLRHYRLWDYFSFGGFADGLHDRDEVARHALKESETHLKAKLDPRQIWVIGDTPLDVKCARAIGANVIAVTTGWHTREELVAAQADYVFDTLEDGKELLAELLQN